jgi:zinc protease
MKHLAWALACALAASAQVGPGPAAGPDPKTQTAPGEAAAGRGAAAQGATPAANPGTPAAAARGGRGAAAPAASGVILPKDLKYPPLHLLQSPPLVAFKLPNGLQLYLGEDHELPLVSGLVMVRAGSLFDPPERIGLATMTASLLRSGGTALKNADTLDQFLETQAASVESGADDMFSRVGFSTLKENAPTVLALVKEMVAQPEFRQDKLDLVRAQLRNAIANRNDDPAAIGRREFAGLIFGKDNPFGWVMQYATVDRVTRADIRAFHHRYFFPANATVGIWGDFNAAEMKAAVEKLFGEWNAPAQDLPAVPKTKEAPAPGFYLAEKKDQQQAFFVIGGVGGKWSDKDAPALQVMCAILGTGSKGRLPQQARARTGADHQIHAIWGLGYDRPGMFQIYGGTRAVGTSDVLRVIQSEVERMRSGEIADEELASAREGLVEGLVFALDTRGKLFARELLLEYLGYPKDFIQQYQKSLLAVTKADVQRVAKQYLAPASLTYLTVADPQLFGEPLERLATAVNKIDIAIPEPKSEPVPSTETSLAEGKQLLSKAQAAVGGAEKLAAVKDYTEQASYQIGPGVQNLAGAKINQTDRWVSPNIFRQDSVLPAGHIASFTDGKVGWISTPQGWGALTGPQQKQVGGDLFRSWFRLLLSDRIEGRTVNAIDEHTVQILDTTGQEARVEFDETTYLPRRVTYDTPQAVGAPIYSEDSFEDYREVDGIKMPFKISIMQAGRKFADKTVNEYKLNSGLRAPDLARRP